MSGRDLGAVPQERIEAGEAALWAGDIEGARKHLLEAGLHLTSDQEAQWNRAWLRLTVWQRALHNAFEAARLIAQTEGGMLLPSGEGSDILKEAELWQTVLWVEARGADVSTAKELLAMARAHFRIDAERAEELTRIVLSVTKWLRATRIEPAELDDQECLAWGYLMNSTRIQGRVVEAQALSERLLEILGDESKPLPLRAELTNLLVSLRRDQGRFNDALTLIDQACSLYFMAGDEAGFRAMQIQEGVLLRLSGEPGKAVAFLGPLANRSHESVVLEFAAKLNYCLAAVEIDHIAEVRTVLPKIEALATQLNEPLSTAKVVFLKALLAQAIGNEAQAERHYLKFQQVYVDAGLLCDAAIGGLKIAEMRIRKGQLRAGAEIAQAVQTIFRQCGLSGWDLQAVSTHLEAVRCQRATEAKIKNVVAQILRTSKAPERRPRR